MSSKKSNGKEVKHRHGRANKRACSAARSDAPAVLESLRCLNHYHTNHADSAWSEWSQGAGKDEVAVLVVSDPAVLLRVRAALEDEPSSVQ